MKTVDEFYKLTNTEDYFNFFNIEYDQKLINVKRFHIMKEYGNLIKKGLTSIKEENKLLDFFKFSLLRVYMDFKNGYSPSAAQVWNMFENGKLSGCSACSSGSTGGNCGC
ncbi:nitrogenase-stabilizing/protective protein NifW [Arcobacter sp. CECT 8985]|uniref:nitrogenase-stabilizing/protective protein NifW n=1 Tax=Arcobacter sp. CECT 8985 TaxID=1935424 RepID=UPI00100B7A67|nr:nitrogenase-stabilizing/protective protein NifW [Arcobacter sp. CECT 8985]RXJ87856.1 nitrogen fixation protein NifW [Arcobacter sp. CECT 8985]